MTHYREKYESKIPIWVATEFLRFGTLIELFRLLDNKDKNEIAQRSGFKTGTDLETPLLGLSAVRNTCTHPLAALEPSIRAHAPEG